MYQLYQVDSKLVKIYPRYKKLLTMASFSPDGKNILTLSNDSIAQIWNTSEGKLIHTLDAHKVTSAVYSPDGQSIVSETTGPEVIIWDPVNGGIQQVLKGKENDHHISAVFSNDSKYIITTTHHRYPHCGVHLWDIKSGEIKQSLDDYDKYFTSSAISPDNRYIIMIYDTLAKVWDIETGKVSHSLTGHNEHINSLSFSHEGKNLVTTSRDEVKIWAIDGQLLKSIDVESDVSPYIRSSPEDLYIITTTYEGMIKVWKVNGGKLLHEFDFESEMEEFGLPTSPLVISPEGELVLIPYGEEVTVCESNTWKPVYSLKPKGWITDATFSPDGLTILTNSSGTIKIWRTRDGKLIHKIKNEKGIGVHSAAFTKDGKYIVMQIIGPGIDEFVLYDIKTKKPHRNFDQCDFDFQETDLSTVYFRAHLEEKILTWELHNGYLFKDYDGSPLHWPTILKSYDQRYMISQKEYYEPPVGVWESVQTRLMYTLQPQTRNFWFGRHSATGKYFSTSDYCIWDTKTADFLYQIDTKPKVADSIAILTGDYIARSYYYDRMPGVFSERRHQFSPDDQYILTDSWDKTVNLWDAETGKLVHKLRGHTGGIISSIFSSDGKHILTSSYDGTSKLWETVNGKIMFDFDSSYAKFSPDGKKIITRSTEHVKLWDVSTRDLLFTFKGHTKYILPAEFSKDGKYIVIASDDGTRIWDVSSGNLIKKIDGHYWRDGYYPQSDGQYDWHSGSRMLGPDNRYIILNNKHKGLGLWSIKSDHEVINFSEKMISYEFSPDGNYIITNSRDGNVKIWDLPNGELLKTLDAHSYYYTVISPDNNSIVTISDYGQSDIWDLATGKPRFSIGGIDILINSVIYSPDGKYLVTNTNSGIIFWDAQNGKRLFTAHCLVGNEIVTHTDDGLFDTSSEAMKIMYWTKGWEIIEFDQLKDRYFEPGLWEKMLGYSDEPLRKARGLNTIESYPDIQLTPPQENNGKLGINLQNRGGGIGKVKIWINGKEVSTDARDPGMNPDAERIRLDYTVMNHPFLKSGDLNIIEVKASNKDDYLTSRGKKIYYIPEGEKKDYEPALYAVVSGASNYQGETLDLRYAAKDARDFAGVLEMVGDAYFSEDKVNITLLATDNENFKQWPTKENLQKAFSDISNTARPNDVLVVYLSGHGTNYGGTEGDFYYLTSDASSGELKDPVVRKNVAISSAELTEYIKSVPALKQVMIIDACHSGQLAEDLMTARATRSSSEIRALERMKDRTGTYVLAGSAADAVSYEASTYGQGLLTYSLLFGMKGAALRENKFVDVMQLFQFAADEVPKMAENIGGIQKPEVRVPYGGQSFDIGISDETVQEKIVLPSPKPVFVRSVFMNEDTYNDDLGLAQTLDEKFRNYSTAKGSEQKLIFIDAAKYTNAYSIKGRYKKTTGGYEVNCRLFKGEEPQSDIHIKSMQADEVVEKVEGEVLKLIE